MVRVGVALMKPDVHRLAADLETAINDGDVQRVLLMIDASRLREQDRRDVCRLLSRRVADVCLVFGRDDQAHILTAA